MRALRGDLDGSWQPAAMAIELEPDSAWSGVGWAAKFMNRAMAQDCEMCWG